MTDAIDPFSNPDDLVILNDLETRLFSLFDSSGWLDNRRKRRVFSEGYSAGRSAGVFEAPATCPTQWNDVKPHYTAGYEIGYLVRWAWRLVPVGIVFGIAGVEGLKALAPSVLTVIGL